MNHNYVPWIIVVIAVMVFLDLLIDAQIIKVG